MFSVRSTFPTFFFGLCRHLKLSLQEGTKPVKYESVGWKSPMTKRTESITVISFFFGLCRHLKLRLKEGTKPVKYESAGWKIPMTKRTESITVILLSSMNLNKRRKASSIAYW
jgi:hypothetical protein